MGYLIAATAKLMGAIGVGDAGDGRDNVRGIGATKLLLGRRLFVTKQCISHGMVAHT
jgi:hypothetical protein